MGQDKSKSTSPPAAGSNWRAPNLPQTEFALEVLHQVYYSNRDAVPIGEIASSLLALERILKRSPRLMSAVTNIPIDRAEVFVAEIVAGSLKEDIIVKLFFRGQEEFDAFC